MLHVAGFDSDSEGVMSFNESPNVILHQVIFIKSLDDGSVPMCTSRELAWSWFSGSALGVSVEEYLETFEVNSNRIGIFYIRLFVASPRQCIF